MSSESQPDESGLMRMFVRHERELRVYARTLLPTWEAVEDTLQEASVVMWKKREQLDDEAAFLPWLGRSFALKHSRRDVGLPVIG
jgi:RNA polymerase sigma-70 factor, ECF subfamily